MTFSQRLRQLEERVRLSEIQLYEMNLKMRRIEKILDQRLQAQLPPFSEIPDIETRPEG